MEELQYIRPVWAEIDLDAFAFTLQAIRKRIGNDAQIAAVVKADGYGHGAVHIVPTLLENGATYLAVAMLDEAIELRQAGFTEVPILILGYTEPWRAKELIHYNIEQTVFTYDLAKAMSDEAVAQHKTAHLHIKADTGMGRLGFLPTPESLDTIEAILRLPAVEFTGLFTHFATADEADKTYTHYQWDNYQFFYRGLEARGFTPKIRHCGNSGVIVDHPEYVLDMVRPGIILYGCYPSPETHNENIIVKPALQLKCRISNVKHEKVGACISYGCHYITSEEDEIIATLPLGYADGFQRLLTNNDEVLVHGQRAKIVGNVCMDQCMINVSHIPNVQIGDEVVIIGTQGDEHIPVEEVANRIPTIAHEIFCGLSKRIPRVYFKNGDITSIHHPLYR